MKVKPSGKWNYLANHWTPHSKDSRGSSLTRGLPPPDYPSLFNSPQIHRNFTPEDGHFTPGNFTPEDREGGPGCPEYCDIPDISVLKLRGMLAGMWTTDQYCGDLGSVVRCWGGGLFTFCNLNNISNSRDFGGNVKYVGPGPVVSSLSENNVITEVEI